MANGDFILMDVGRWSIKLLDAQVASHTGVWVEIPPKFSIRSFWTDLTAETSTATIDIMVSNAVAKPADATDGPVARTLTGTATGAAGTGVEAYRWVKAKKTAGGTPAASSCVVEAR